jgi:DNA invertase Pin-like site-specific DNA recombinase
MTACKVSAASESGAPRLAFSYQRVSSGKQAEEGRAGIDRQADAFIGFCQRHGLTPNADPLVDRGLSAFHGRHRSRGALGTFISAAEAGRIPPGSVLVVEDLDRFSRETASHTQELLLALFRQELALGIVRDDVVVDREVHDNPSNPGIRLMLMTRGDAAHDYSRKLSGRISDVWQRRRQDWEEHRKPYLGKGSRPEWLTDDGIGFVEIPDAVEVVRRIFKLASEGNMGGTQIAELLSGEGVKPVRAAVYGPIRILRILHDRRVLGEKEWRDGSVSHGYFPRIIDQRLWEAAQKAIDARHKNKLRHGRGEVIGNLFQGISFCSCGRVLSLQRSQNRQAVKLYEVLRCSGRRTHTCPKPKGDYKYDEEALLHAFMRHRWQAFFDRPADTRKRRALEKRLRDLESLHAEQQQQASTAAINMSELLKTGELDAPTAAMLGKASSDASAAAAATQRSIQAIQAQIQQLNLQPSSADLQRQIRERVQGFIASDRHDIDERRRFNNWVMGLGVRLVVVDPKQLSIEPAIKATYDDAGGVTVAGAELVVRVP